MTMRLQETDHSCVATKKLQDDTERVGSLKEMSIECKQDWRQRNQMCVAMVMSSANRDQAEIHLSDSGIFDKNFKSQVADSQSLSLSLIASTGTRFERAHFISYFWSENRHRSRVNADAN